MEKIKIEQENNNFEYAHDLAKALAEEFLKRYDLETGHRIENKTGASFDTGMDFWNYRILLNNKGEKPKSKEALVFIFEEVINTMCKQYVNNGPERDGSYSGINDLNEIYKFFVLHNEKIHKGLVDIFKHRVEHYLEKGFEELNKKPEIIPNFSGFNKN